MLKLKLCAALAATILFTAITSPAQTPPPATAPPSPEQSQLLKNTEAFIRTLFAWGPDFAVKLGPLSPSPSPDFYLVPLTVTIHDQTDTGSVFVSKDGKTFLRGEMYDTSLNPFADNVKKLGLTVQSLDSALYSAFGQSEVSIIYTQLNQYYVVLEVAPQYWQSPEGLKDIYLQTSGKDNIPLLTMANGRANTTPLAINHTGLFPSVTVSFNLAPGVSLSDATARINQMQQRLGTLSWVRGFFSGALFL